MRRKRNVLSAILLVVLIALLLSACSGKDDKIKLSELEDSELIQRLIDFGVVIPKGVTIDGIREWIAELEADPAHPAPFVSWTAITDLYEGLRTFVIARDN